MDKQDSSLDWVTFGPFTLFPGQRSLKRDGKPVHIGDKPLDLLITLVKSPGSIFSKTELTERVWHREWVEDANLRVTICALRKILGQTEQDSEYIVNTVGRGYSFSAAVSLACWPQASAEYKAQSTLRQRPSLGRLPFLINRVIGRQTEIARVVDLIDRCRLTTLVGPGGVGKTTVAVSSASLYFEAGEDVCFVDFSSVRDPALVSARLAAVLGWVEQDGHPTKYVVEHLSEKKCLLVLDNCEQIANAIAILAEEILCHAPRVKLLVTSREPLRAEGEVVYRLAPLAYPLDAAQLDVQSALAYPAVQLFVERAQAAHSKFALTKAQVPSVVEICRRLDGIAFAIQLAASRVSAFGVVGLASRLDDPFRLLSQGQRTALPRHRTLEAAFDWSYALLTEPERTVIESISIFSQAFSLDDAVDVACSPEIGACEVEVILANLVDKSLVTFSCEEHPQPYRLPETVRAFARCRRLSGSIHNPRPSQTLTSALNIISHKKAAYAGGRKG